MGFEKVNGRRWRRDFRGPCLVLLLLTTAPARSADPDAVIRLLAAQDAAVVETGERLSIAAWGLCPVGGWASGLVVQARTQYGLAYRDAATRVLGLGDYPTITFVTPGSGANRAGLVPGDQIVAIDDRKLPVLASTDVAPRMTDIDDALDALDAGLRDGEADMQIVRKGVPSTIRLRGTPSCRARFEVRAGRDTNASATRDRVQVSSDLVDPTRAEQDLAPLIAHELSHVILGHEEALKGSQGGLFPGFTRKGAVLRASEIAADRMSIYVLALASYRPADAIPFWTALGRRTSMGIFSDRTHPAWQTRVAAIRVEVSRVEAQQAAGEPITPPADLLVTPSR